MRSRFRTLAALLLVVGGVYACSTATETSRVGDVGFRPLFARHAATDSNLRETPFMYGDTTLVMKRPTPLDTDLSVTAVIGSAGGELRLDAAGVHLFIPRNALAASTEITLTAKAGSDVAYEFAPHGLTFRLPVIVRQDLARTAGAVDPGKLVDVRGAYYDRSLDSSFVDDEHAWARIRETQLGYVDAEKRFLRFFIGHFSGYLVSWGFTKGS